MKIPRKKKKQIPTGVYCYTLASEWKMFKDGKYGVAVKTCPFYRNNSDTIFGYCRLIDAKVMDQCKSCCLKLGF